MEEMIEVNDRFSNCGAYIINIMINDGIMTQMCILSEIKVDWFIVTDNKCFVISGYAEQ